jgi:hypothetical protein
MTFMVVSLTSLPLEQLVESLKQQNAMFCPVNQLAETLQQESDRVQLLQLQMRMIDNYVLDSGVSRSSVAGRAHACLEDGCPICFGQYFENEGASSYLPVFMRCC